MKKTLMMVGAVLGLGCGVTEAQSVDGDDSQLGGALSTRSRSYVTLRRDLRRCPAPKCGGWWVQDLNRVTPTEQYVSGLDFSASALDEVSQHDVTTAPDGELVLFGKLGASSGDARPFVVSTGWRGMPGARAGGVAVYRVEPVDIRCLVAPCPTLKATKLNTTTALLVHDVDVGGAALGLVDQTWLTHRVSSNHALVAANLVNEGKEVVVKANQVFVALPDTTLSCLIVPVPRCTNGAVLSWQRTADRCVMPLGCVTPGDCSAVVPTCERGYTLRSWAGGLNACQQYACDPDFLFDE